MYMLPCLFLVVILTVSCRNDMDKVHFFDPQNLPHQSLDTVRMVRSTNGNLQLLVSAPKVVVRDDKEKKTEYPDGFSLQFFDRSDKPVAVISADYAYSLDEKKIIEARRNVVVIDYRSGDTSYLESIVWDSPQGRIYSNDPVKSVNGQRVTYGDGFESDENFTTPQITHQRGTIQLKDD